MVPIWADSKTEPGDPRVVVEDHVELTGLPGVVGEHHPRRPVVESATVTDGTGGADSLGVTTVGRPCSNENGTSRTQDTKQYTPKTI